MDLQRIAAGSLVEAQTFVDVDVQHLAQIELYKCRFETCRFSAATLARVVFEDCEFVGCDLTRVLWGSSSLRQVRFIDCKLLGVDFSQAKDNPDVTFERCLLRYALFPGVNLRGTRFLDCQLQEASFTEADLQDADFGGSDVNNAVLQRCSLAGADFSTTTGLVFEPGQNQSKDAFIAVETAIQMARAAGLRVAGHDEAKASKRKRR